MVRANDLVEWASTFSAREDLPGLVARLIRGSCPRLESYRFPTGDASQTHGFDGVVDSPEGSTFVPVGRSIWEFGTGNDYKAKATGDYGKRTAELTPAARAEQSFIFVTPRIWDTGLGDWEQARSNDGWKNVTIVDANSLELWLADNPAVSIDLAVQLGKIPPSGVRTIRQFWEEFRLNFDPPLVTEILLTGREEQARLFCEGLSTGIPGMDQWKADSAKEVVAFLAAALMKAEPEVSKFLLSKTLLVETEEAAGRLPGSSPSNLIVLPAASKVGPALARSKPVILALGINDRSTTAKALERMNTRDFAIGLKAMGIDEHEAFRLAVTCGRSITVLSRLKASGIKPEPAWHDSADLIPIVLAGAWDANNEYDCAVIAKLCDKAYDGVDKDARKFATAQDPPLDLEGSVWVVRSAHDAFTLLGRLVDTATQQRLKDACIEVFSEIDQTLNVREDQRSLVPVRGADFNHSEWLRRGLATTLLLISGLHDAAGFKVIGRGPEDFVDDVVGAIPGIANDIRVLASLKAQFPTLAEAAPVPLVSALERVLEGESEAWATVIYADSANRSLWGSSSPHTYLLWGLETVAWSPKYLHRAASILMRLAQFDPGGTLANRPLGSLVDIFRAWRPQTYCTPESRIAILRTICNSNPKLGLDLAMSLLPKIQDHTSGTAKPRVKDFGDAGSSEPTPEIVRLAYNRYAELAAALASTDIRRLTAIVDHLPELSETARTSVVSAIRCAAESSSEEDNFRLWTAVRHLVQKHEQFQDARWAIPIEQLKPIAELCGDLEPKDPVLQIKWLFDDYVPRMGRSGGSDYIGAANLERAEAVQVLLDKQGLPTVLTLARRANLPHFVGTALVEAAPDVHILEEALAIASRPDSDIDPDFSIAVSARAHAVRGAKWDQWISAFVRGMNAGSAANLFLRWPDSRETWSFVSALGNSIEFEYWKRKHAFPQSSDTDLLFALDMYIHVGRFSACLEIAAYEEARVSTQICFRILRGFITEVNADAWKLQNTQYSVVHMIETLQTRQDVTNEELAALEYQFLPLLEHDAVPVALHRMLNESPEFFVDVICDVFLPSTREETQVITEVTKNKARNGYRLLQSIKTVPGFTGDVQDISFLRTWVTGVRRFAREKDRVSITDQQIGQVLANAPSDPSDGAWPIAQVRDLIEEVASDHLETGISVARFNMRGVFTKNVFEGGTEERAFAAEYRKWAALTLTWPRTSLLLGGIAENWMRQAEKADAELELNQLR
jgi:hypothetical protein